MGIIRGKILLKYSNELDSGVMNADSTTQNYLRECFRGNQGFNLFSRYQ